MGRGTPPSGAADLGDVAVMPGLVNAHTHLEFSDCQRPIGTPGIPLDRWIGEVIARRGVRTPAQRNQAIGEGIDQSRRAGVRLLGEITTPPSDYPTGLDWPQIVSFAEILGLDPKRGEERLAAAVEHHRRYDSSGFSPHAPYSTSLRLICRCVDRARRSGKPLAMHVAESPAERQLITGGDGPLAESLRELGVWREGCFPWSKRGYIDLLEILADAPEAIIVHGNDLRKDEIDWIAGKPNMTVVYCPRTHAFFDYQPHPVDRLLRAGVRVALGTDSRASNPDLNLWREVQFLMKHRQDLEPSDVLAMATTHGAEGLGRPRLGRIEARCAPGLGIVATTAAEVDQVWQDLAENDYCPLPM
jgi:cytosine/adenosine deaminase-related metal-dependent hydrolase